MSLVGSLNTSVNGLLSQSYALSNTSNNIANATTTAYKADGTNFEDVVTNCFTSDSSGTCGTSAKTTHHNDSQGTIQSVLSPTSLAINGNGYFAVGSPNEAGICYTRYGDFARSADGHLENSQGYYLLGYSAAAPTTMVAVEFPATLSSASVPTTTLDYVANLNASAAIGATSPAATTNIYNTSATSQAVSYTWDKIADNQWQVTISAPGGAYDTATATPGDFTATALVDFDTTGHFGAITAVTPNLAFTGDTLSFGLQYPGADLLPVSSSLSGVTQYASVASTISTVSSFTQDGAPMGSYSGINIDKSGLISVNYSNGISTPFYTIPLATFPNENGLMAIDGNAFKMSLLSGDATYNAVGTGGAGSLNVGSLESSNVDLASEFTDLIKTQQVYSANAKTVSTVNAMMQTLIQLQT
jgi:flagellar hook protein FlgE